MDLKSELKKLNDEFTAGAPPEVQNTFSRIVKSLRNSGIVELSPKKGDKVRDFGLNNIYRTGAGREIGEKIEDFILKDHQGEEVSLADLLKHGPVVLNFYRGNWCPYCSLELRALQHHLSKFHERNAVLVAISPEKPDESIKTMTSLHLDYIVLSDPGAKVARQFRLAYRQEAQNKLFTGVDIAAHNNDDAARYVIPATYIIASDFSVRFAFADEDFSNRVDPEELIRVLDEIKSEGVYY